MTDNARHSADPVKDVRAVLELRIERQASPSRDRPAVVYLAGFAIAALIVSVGLIYSGAKALPSLLASSIADPVQALIPGGMLFLGFLGLVAVRCFLPEILEGLVSRRSVMATRRTRERLESIKNIHPKIRALIDAHMAAGHPLLVEDLVWMETLSWRETVDTTQGFARGAGIG